MKDLLLKAIEKAKESVKLGGFPAGAVIVKDGIVIGEGVSIGNVLHDPTSHGEVASIREACKNLSTADLSGATMYSSMEPCSMCLSAAMWSGVSKMVYACSKEKVSKEYYGGQYQTSMLNDTFIKSIQMQHVPELEEESLEVVTGWENK